MTDYVFRTIHNTLTLLAIVCAGSSGERTGDINTTWLWSLNCLRWNPGNRGGKIIISWLIILWSTFQWNKLVCSSWYDKWWLVECIDHDMFSKLEAVPTSENHQYNPLSFIHLSPKLFRPLLNCFCQNRSKNFRILSVPSIEIILWIITRCSGYCKHFCIRTLSQWHQV